MRFFLTRLILIFAITTFITNSSESQSLSERMICGKIVDDNTGEELPFTNVYVRGTLIGVTSDFDGTFCLKVPNMTDSISFSALSYKYKGIALKDLDDDDNIIRLKPDAFNLTEIVVSPDDAPRRLMRQVIANKQRNDPTKYQRTSYEKYTRWEYALNNISDKATNNWLLKNTQNLMRLDEDSNKYLPVYFSETLSFNETQKKPKKMRATILGDNTKGIDIFKQYEIGGFSSAMDIEVSFYDNIVKIVGGVGFVSPLADNALQYYKYYITDSTYMADSTKVYTVKYKPKDLGNKAFEGTMDIETKYFSLQRIDAKMPKYTNINFVKKLSFNSTYQFVNDSLPFFGTNEMELHVDYMPINSDKKRLEIKCNMFNSQRDITLNQPEPLELSKKALAYETIKSPNYKQLGDDFWNQNRHSELTKNDIEANNSIDSLNNVSSVKTFNLMVKLAMTGYLDVGKVEIGPYSEMFNSNKIEGIHVGFGLRTSEEISKNWMFMGLVGYGFKNSRPTCQGGVGYRFKTPFMRTMQLTYYDRLIKIGENENILYLYENMLTTSETNLVAQIFKREVIDELMYERKIQLKYDREWITGISSRLTANAKWQYSPKYYPFTQDGNEVKYVENQEIAFDTRFSFDEKFIDDGMQRVYMSTDYPIIHVTVAVGNAKVADKEQQYARIHSTIKHMKYLGQCELHYALEGGMYFGTLPYTLLDIPRGNKTYGFYQYDFNMLNYLEFVNDKYLYAYVDYYINGRILNKIPHMSKVGLREVVGFKAMLGSLSDKHLTMLDLPDKLSALNGGYIELNAGIDNILRFFRVDAVWRITNKNKSESGAPTFGFRAQFNFKL